MEKIRIGYQAGKVWQVIDRRKLVKITDLKMITRMDIKDVYLALGWLARENKISFLEKDRELAVGLA
jgi:Winged helix-turn-helix domain (DUF2582)